jgi:mannose-6-phosphate isomerase-like protein (cupin superfamily)
VAGDQKPKLKVMQAGEGLLLSIAGGQYTIKASGEDSGGAFALIEMLIPPGAGPPPHTHSRETEVFYILEGELAIEVGDRSVTAAAGAYVQAPPGLRHVFRNPGKVPARVLLLAVPGGIEKFFQEISQAPLAAKPRLPAILDPVARVYMAHTAAKYGIEIHKEGNKNSRR